MTDQKQVNSDNVIAQQTQEKFEFYLLSLVFTLLALSIQTAKFEMTVPANLLELAGWIFFIISGISGLSRMQWNPIIRITLAQRSGYEEEIYKLKELQLKGETEIFVLEDNAKQPLSVRIEHRDNAIKILTPYIAKLDLKDSIKYNLHVYCFVLGILSVICARAYTPALSIYYSLFS
jgi:hypothetical protein